MLVLGQQKAVLLTVWYLVVLGQYRAVLGGTWWYWVSIGCQWLIYDYWVNMRRYWLGRGGTVLV